jgi:orotate phosphoribosyltransferase
MSDKTRKRLMEIVLERSFKLGDFTLSSGKKSDYYVDCRTTSLHPEGTCLMARLMLPKIIDMGADAVGGLTLGADPVTASVIFESFLADYPLMGFIVRKEQKKHGTGLQIEGNLKKEHTVVVLEDVITTGGSALQAVEAVRQAGAKVVGVMAIVDRQEGGREAIKKEGLKVHSIFTASELKKEAAK